MHESEFYTREAEIISNGLSSAEREVNAVIDNYAYLRARLLVGDLSGTPYLFAIEKAIEEATLTAEQRTILDAYLSDMSVTNIARLTGKKKPSIVRTKRRIVRRLAYHYEALLTKN